MPLHFISISKYLTSKGQLIENHYFGKGMHLQTKWESNLELLDNLHSKSDDELKDQPVIGGSIGFPEILF